jgi:CRISPR-associated protein Csx14
MAEASIPVDLFNPGQVFACLGFMEAAEILLGGAEGGFDWSRDPEVRFVLRADGEADPVREVLGFLAEATPRRFAPHDYRDPPLKKKARKDRRDDDAEDEDEGSPKNPPDSSATFPSSEPDRMSLPIRLGGGSRPQIELTHWADGSGRDPFKLYAGNRSALGIAAAMLDGIRRLYEAQRDQLVASPFDVLAPMGGSFNFDPRGAWTAIDAGYSPNDQRPKHQVLASPVVEMLAPWGLEHARPKETGLRRYVYATWREMLAPALARTALACALGAIERRCFRVRLDLSGKNKVITFATEDSFE